MDENGKTSSAASRALVAAHRASSMKLEPITTTTYYCSFRSDLQVPGVPVVKVKVKA